MRRFARDSPSDATISPLIRLLVPHVGGGGPISNTVVPLRYGWLS